MGDFGLWILIKPENQGDSFVLFHLNVSLIRLHAREISANCVHLESNFLLLGTEP